MSCEERKRARDRAAKDQRRDRAANILTGQQHHAHPWQTRVDTARRSESWGEVCVCVCVCVCLCVDLASSLTKATHTHTRATNTHTHRHTPGTSLGKSVVKELIDG